MVNVDELLRRKLDELLRLSQEIALVRAVAARYPDAEGGYGHETGRSPSIVLTFDAPSAHGGADRFDPLSVVHGRVGTRPSSSLVRGALYSIVALDDPDLGYAEARVYSTRLFDVRLGFERYGNAGSTYTLADALRSTCDEAEKAQRESHRQEAAAAVRVEEVGQAPPAP